MSPGQWPAWAWLTVILVPIVLLIAFLVWVQSAGQTCDEMRAEMLSMTGPNATAEYDPERVRELNRELDENCR